MIHQLYYYNYNTLFLAILIASILSSSASTSESKRTIYDVLKLQGLPMGLLPKGVKDYSYDDDSGRFEVELDEACNAKFENELHYDQYISGILNYGEIIGLSGISVQDLFLWFEVKEVRVDVPSSGLIYFDVGVVSKQFSVSSFETPKDCLPVKGLHPHTEQTFIKQHPLSDIFRYRLRYKEMAMATW